MTRITKILAVPATGAHYYEDLSALQADAATSDAGIVRGVTEALSVGLVLDSGQIAWGDCVAAAPGSTPLPMIDSTSLTTPGSTRLTTHSDTAGRANVFRAAQGLTTLQDVVAPTLQGRRLASFRALVAELDALTEVVEVMRPATPSPSPADREVQDLSRRQLLASMARLLTPEPEAKSEEKPPLQATRIELPLHPAVRYGVSQALLGAVAQSRGIPMAEVLAQEWDLPRPDTPVPLHARSGRERYLSADNMIVRRVASLPHARVENISEHLGRDGVKLIRYVNWLRERIQELGDADYQPILHLDLGGAAGQIYENNLGKVLGLLYTLEMAARPYSLRVEDPIIMESHAAQIEALEKLREYVRLRKMNVQLVASAGADTLDHIRAFVDAQAADLIHIKMPDLGGVHNSIEAVLACQAGGLGTLLGGHPAETDLAARVSVHVALATRPDLMTAKPGLGVDEAISVVQNEMARTLAWIQVRS